VLAWWLGWLGQAFIVWIVAVAWFAGGPLVGFLCSVGQVAFACWWATRAERLLDTVLTEHRRLAGVAA
jgi:hypothetical protein